MIVCTAIEGQNPDSPLPVGLYACFSLFLTSL